MDITGYLLIIAGFCIIIGRIADRHGLKRTFREGVLIFSAASLFCFAAGDVYLLIVASRLLQAAGAAVFLATGHALIAAGLPFGERGTGLSWIGAGSLAGSVAGIGIGGLVCGLFGWRSFLIMLLVGLAAFLAGRRYIRNVPAQPSGGSFDFAGSILLFFAMVTLLLGVSMDYQPAIPDLVPHALYILSVLPWAGFILHAQRTPEPILDITLFKNRQFSYAVIGKTIMDLTMGGIMFLLPFILTLGLGFPVLTASFILMVAAGFAILVSPVAGHLSDRFGSRPVCIAGAFLTLLTLAGFTLVTWDLILFGILIIILIRISSAICSSRPPSSSSTIARRGRRGLQTSRNAAYTVGIAIFVLIFEGAPYSAGLPADGTPILITLPVLIFGILARDRKEERGRQEQRWRRTVVQQGSESAGDRSIPNRDRSGPES